MCARFEAQILSKLKNGNYQIVDRKPNILSALGAVPKKNSPKERLIYDCGRTTYSAANEITTTEHYKINMKR